VSARTTLVLLAVLLGSAAMAFFVQGPGRADRSSDRAALLPGLKAGDVALVRATRAATEVLLTRAGDAWQLGAAKEPADGAAVEILLAKLVDVREGAVVSTNPAKQSVYETDAESGISVRLESAEGSIIAAFVIGKSGPDFASCYLRRDGSSEVMLVSPDVRTDFARPAESWKEPPQQEQEPVPEPAPGSAQQSE